MALPFSSNQGTTLRLVILEQIAYDPKCADKVSTLWDYKEIGLEGIELKNRSWVDIQVNKKTLEINITIDLNEPRPISITSPDGTQVC